MIKRSAALGLITVPTMSFLSACASGDSGGDEPVKKGKTSAKNPLGVNESAALDVVIFNGGFGEQYAKDAEKVYQTAFPPKAKVKHAATQKIQSQLQPRFNGGTPPDLIDNSGAEQMDMGVLVGKKQLLDLTPLMDAPVLRRPEQEGPRHPASGRSGDGPVRRRPGLDHVLRVHRVRRLVLADQPGEAGREYPEDWDAMLALCAKAKKKGVAGWTYPGKYPYYLPFSLYPFIGKIGGREVLDKIDNLEPNAWKDPPAVKAAFEAYYELYKKGYILKGTPPGLTHIQSQTEWTKGKALFIPNGSWVENEAAPTTPKDFKMMVAAPPPAWTRPTRCPSAPSGVRRRALHRPGQGEEPAGRHGAAAYHALRGVLEELHQAGQVPQCLQRRHRRPDPLHGHAGRCRRAEEGRRQRGEPAHAGLVREAPEGADRHRGHRRDDGRTPDPPGRGHQEDPAYADAAAKDQSIKHYKHQ